MPHEGCDPAKGLLAPTQHSSFLRLSMPRETYVYLGQGGSGSLKVIDRCGALVNGGGGPGGEVPGGTVSVYNDVD